MVVKKILWVSTSAFLQAECGVVSTFFDSIPGFGAVKHALGTAEKILHKTTSSVETGLQNAKLASEIFWENYVFANSTIPLERYHLVGDDKNFCEEVPTNSTCRPLAILHAAGRTCHDERISKRIKTIQRACPNVCIACFQEDGDERSVLTPMSIQLLAISRKFKRVPAYNTDIGFNLAGLSQGGLLARSYVQVVNDPKVHNLISISSPQAGIADCPSWLQPETVVSNSQEHTVSNVCKDFADFIDIYNFQHCSFCGYWKDIFSGRQEYLNKSTFLAYINNDYDDYKNSTFKENMVGLNKYFLARGTNETTIYPPESSFHEFFPFDSHEKTDTEIFPKRVIPLHKDPSYVNDYIGLKTLDSNKKLKFSIYDGDHLEFSDVWFHENVLPLLTESVTHANHTKHFHEEDENEKCHSDKQWISHMVLASRTRFGSAMYHHY